MLDLSKEKGGLTPIQRGGGQATASIRLENSEGKQYVLRSIEKSAAKTIPAFAEKTWAQDVFQDQLSAIHPYSALVIPPLAEAAGIYHTNPEVVYVPKQNALGGYNENFGNALYLFEERPAGDQEDCFFFRK